MRIMGRVMLDSDQGFGKLQVNALAVEGYYGPVTEPYLSRDKKDDST